jgi:transposase
VRIWLTSFAGSDSVIGGVDTHGHSHHAAVIDGVGRQLDDREFPASPAGYGALLEWLRGYGELDRVGVAPWRQSRRWQTATKTALRRLARRHQQLSEEIAEADHELDQLVHQVAPALLALPGVGPEVAGQGLTSAGDNPNRIKSEAAFAHFCGAAPIPTSSGRTRRHRLNRGGDRGANNALYVVVLGRLRYDSRTRAYVDRRTQEGLSKPEIIRCLKRYVARELYNALPTSIAENRSQQPLARP